MQRLLGKADKTPALFERACECLQSLGLLLEDHSCRGGTTPQLQGCDSHLLAVGAYMTGIRHIDANSTIITWLQTHIQVCLHSVHHTADNMAPCFYNLCAVTVQVLACTLHCDLLVTIHFERSCSCTDSVWLNSSSTVKAPANN